MDNDDPKSLSTPATSEQSAGGKSDDLPNTVTSTPQAVSQGRSIGPYRLVSVLGEGGMGTVWVANQESPVRRQVAVKLIKQGLNSSQVLQRFEAERQSLAMMNHPNIARVFDAGTTIEGLPYFVMEFIKGIPITSYCDQANSTIRERLLLFVQICRATQHAHQKGIIHRDLKPSNILVALQDGQPVIKIIDFGVAKALYQQLTDRTLHTEVGQVIGTLEYMAPEQAETSLLDVDTRVDIYALGVILYELLVGSTPIKKARLKSAGMVEVLRIIKEEDPPKPSTRLTESKEQLPNLATKRQIEPRLLASELRGELDWIVMKALEKDRSRRYETATGFGKDVERYLAGDPIEARPTSASYRFAKLFRKHRTIGISLVAVFAALTIGITLAALGMIKARSSEAVAKKALEDTNRLLDAEKELRAEADRERAIAMALNDFLRTDLLSGASLDGQRGLGVEPESGLTVAKLLDRADEKIASRFAAEPLLELELRRTIGQAFASVGSGEAACRNLKRCFDISMNLYGADSEATLHSRAEWVQALAVDGQNLFSIEQGHQLIDELRSKPYGKNRSWALVHYWVAYSQHHTKQFAEALLSCRAGQETFQGSEGEQQLFSLRWMEVTSLENLGRGQEAVDLCQSYRLAAEAKLGESHRFTVSWKNRHSTSSSLSGKSPQERIASQLALVEQTRKLVDADHMTALSNLYGLALEYGYAGDFENAERTALECLTLRRKRQGETHPATMATLARLGEFRMKLERYAAAEEVFRELIEKNIAINSEDHSYSVEARVRLIEALAPQLKGKEIVESIKIVERLVKKDPLKLNPLLRRALRAECAWALKVKSMEELLEASRIASAMEFESDDFPRFVATAYAATASRVNGEFAEADRLEKQSTSESKLFATRDRSSQLFAANEAFTLSQQFFQIGAVGDSKIWSENAAELYLPRQETAQATTNELRDYCKDLAYVFWRLRNSGFGDSQVVASIAQKRKETAELIASKPDAVPEDQFEVASALRGIACSQERNNQPKQALENHRKVIHLLSAPKEEGKNGSVTHDWNYCHLGIAIALDQLRDFQQADIAWANAAEIISPNDKFSVEYWRIAEAFGCGQREVLDRLKPIYKAKGDAERGPLHYGMLCAALMTMTTDSAEKKELLAELIPHFAMLFASKHADPHWVENQPMAKSLCECQEFKALSKEDKP